MKSLLLTLCAFATVITLVSAQPVNSPNDDGPSEVPIDGGASILLGAGAIMGYKRLTKKK